MRGCRTARARIAAALDRELGLEERFRLERHLEACPACRDHEGRAQRLEEWLEGPGDRAPVGADVGAAALRVFDALERGEGRPFEVRGPRRARLAGIGLVGGAVALLAALLLWHSRTANTPPAGPPTPPDLVQVESAPARPLVLDSWTPARVDLALRAALLEAFPDEGDPRAGAAAYARFQERLLGAARAGWPLRRLVEGLLEHRDVVLARAAARCLAWSGDAGSAAALERVLGRPEVSEVAFDALAALGECSVPALERALDAPDRALRALNRLCRVGGERAALAIERRLQRTGPDSEPSRASLLDALTSTGRPAVAALLRLAAHARGAQREQVLERLLFVEGAGDELVRLLQGTPLGGDVAYPALALLQPVAALPWLEERCGEHRERPAVLATLAGFPGTAPLGALRRLWQAGRITREDALGLLRELAQRDPRRVLEDTEALIESRDAVVLYDWTLLLIESEHPGAAPSLACLAFCDTLGPDDRQWAALAVGELGGERDARLLADLLRGRETEDRRRTAACLLSIHAHEGVEGVVRALPDIPIGALRALLEALESEPRAGAIRVHRVTRVLDGVLAGLPNPRRSKKEI